MQSDADFCPLTDPAAVHLLAEWHQGRGERAQAGELHDRLGWPTWRGIPYPWHMQPIDTRTAELLEVQVACEFFRRSA